MNILSLSGFTPEQICDTVRFTGYDGGSTVSYYCKYVSDFISMVRENPDIDGTVFPRTCDSCRIISSFLGDLKDKFQFCFHVPSRRDGMAMRFLSKEIISYKQAIEEYFHVQISESQIEDRVLKIQERNEDGRKMYDDLQYISFSAYLSMIHEMLKLPLDNQKIPSDLPKKSSDGSEYKRVYLIGSSLCDVKIAEKIEDSGLSIVGDNLPESKRLFMESFTDPYRIRRDDIYSQIASSMLSRQLSPTQNNFAALIENDLREIHEKDIKGVIFVTQKYCEPYDFLFSVYKRALSEKQIPALQLSVSGSTHERNLDLSIEAFADML